MNISNGVNEKDKKMEHLIAKVNEMKKSGTVDLSLEEDLSIAIMNLVSLEEHFFFTAEKTKKDEYFNLLEETREIRKSLLGRMIDSHEGETWCISKHLLAASMRVMEVATKLQGDGKKEEAKEMFGKAYHLYSMFWALRLKLVDMKGVKKVSDDAINVHDEKGTKKPWSVEDIVEKLVNCCDE
ncbi:MAG: hypothetical protein WCW78_00770 [Candidatus Paceibacterota bacterium]|jgi:hypothetical protein